ncbi:GMC oxidoreductase [Hypholoma sublateritium FD-334 SS-4]|uniref:GMC oxidoreductase n=1 Tax=Hypholoma sublateritium (strain FD-334 SS-4) TaxID=945553 RepID=A0A0D2NYZ2_HYPSF|nr:GMC oxidoreductase [Hypholoma sublateritium FD-334 SS-4]
MTASIEQVSGKAFDFVVIAGLVLAARLSEDQDKSVLVLEAGPANLNDPLILTPYLFGIHYNNPNYDWAFQTIPQETLGGRSIYSGRGKTLGGSSAINFFQFHRPSKSHIDAFEKLGNPGWNWDLFSKYFDISTNFIPPSEESEFASHDHSNENGPLNYSYPMSYSGLERPYHQALKSIGIDVLKDPTIGTWITPVTIDPTTKTRTYAANMYYEPNMHRSNLVVLTKAHVTKVNLKTGSNGEVTATGVNFIHGEDTHTVEVRKEVVLSAGTFMSPQILELSGIGRKDVLGNAGIEVILDLQGVGENVQEHVYSGTSFELKGEVQDQFTTFDCLRDPAVREKQTELFAHGKGAMAMSFASMTFFPLAKATPAADDMYRDLEKSISAGIAANRYSQGLQKQYKLQLESIQRGDPVCEILMAQSYAASPNAYKKIGTAESIDSGTTLPEPGKKYITMSSFLNNPFSRGTVHIQSSDPLQAPAIDPHYFEEEHGVSASPRRACQIEPSAGQRRSLRGNINRRRSISRTGC